MGRYAKPRFNANATFVVSKPKVRFNGRDLSMGTVIDKSECSVAKLRNLYGASKVRMTTDAEAPAQRAQEPAQAPPPPPEQEPKPAVEAAPTPTVAGEQAVTSDTVVVDPTKVEQTPEPAKAAEPASTGIVGYEIKKGPRGFWYQYVGGNKRIPKAYKSQAEAQLAPPPDAAAATVTDDA
jgi:hypothetical protein